MASELLRAHLDKRLKYIHLSGIATLVIFFFLLFYLWQKENIETLYAQLTLLTMAGLIVLSYITLLVPSEKEPHLPLFLFFVLNICTSVLVATTGILQSPFTILYVILIIITAQLYHYGYGLLQALLALCGFVVVYGAAINDIIPFYSLLPYTDQTILFQPTPVILVYGILYALLFLFTVLSSSNARLLLYRPMQKLDIDTTYQEKIINEMPLSVLVVDNDLTILASNPSASAHVPAKIPSSLSEYLPFAKDEVSMLLKKLSSNGEAKTTVWKSDTGVKTPVKLTAHLLKGQTEKGDTYIVFLQ
jgi:hypothetical protein